MRKANMKKPYEGHEIAYKRLKKEGILSWSGSRKNKRHTTLHGDIKVFLKDVLSQPWAPKSGRVIELGCGTGPIDRKGFYKECEGYKFVNNIIYVPFEDNSYEKLAAFNDKTYLPTRYVADWKDILTEIKQAGFESKLIRYHANNFKDTFGTLTVGSVK
ncbi:MAG: hypothetical protein PHF37_02060 [Phycisphaerae bacterium]|nr:hypothetical protein [Phycisphaerae bacterium]